MTDKLSELDTRFNSMILKLVRGLLEISEGEVHPLDKVCCSILGPIESRMIETIRDNPSSPEYSRTFYEASRERHDMIVKRDEHLFTSTGDYFVQLVGGISLGEHISTYLFRRLDGQGQTCLWKWILEMYRISVVVHIYMSNPTIKEIINILLKDGVDQSKMMENLMSGVKSKKKLGRLMRKLTRSTDETFQGIIDSLKRVIETFCVSDDATVGANPALASLCTSLASTGVDSEELMQNAIEQLRISGLIQPELIKQLDTIVAGGGTMSDMETIFSTLSMGDGADALDD